MIRIYIISGYFVIEDKKNRFCKLRLLEEIFCKCNELSIKL